MSTAPANPSRRTVLRAGAMGATASVLPGRLALAKPSTRPNIVLVILDQMTERMVNAHGGTSIRTPSLDRLVSMGTSFTESYCADPSCCPARASLMTGRPSSEHGVLLNRNKLEQSIPDIGTWMREVADYEAWYVGKWHIPGRLVHKSFDVINHGSMWGQACDISVVRSFEGRLANHGDKPFFSVLSLLNPHDIAQYINLESPGKVASCQDLDLTDLPELPVNFNTSHQEARIHHQIRRRDPIRDRWTPLKWQMYLWWYHRQVEMVDGVVGRLLDLIYNSRHRDNTLFILTADHGEMQAEHGLVMKQSLYYASARVPLMVSWPGVLPKGRIDRDHLVSALDLVPTICDFAGVAAPPKVRGASLKGLLEGNSSEWRDYLQVQSAVEGRMIRTANYKHIQYRKDPTEQLFQVRKDPWELEELSSESTEQSTLEEMRQLHKEAEARLEPLDLSIAGYDAAFAAGR